MPSPRFLLASASPRRLRLLSEAGLHFDVVSPATREISSRALTVREITMSNAVRKSMAVARHHPDAVVLGADTLVALDGAIIGKPANFAAATRTLQRLSGHEHAVCTAVFLCHLATQKRISFQVLSQVRFRLLGEAEIRAYLERINPLDKAGAYAAQGDGSEIIAQIRGSYTNVVGLPMGETLRALRHFGIQPERREPRA